MKNRFNHLFICVVLVLMSIVSNSISQDLKKFATKGSIELGGNISFKSMTSVTNGNTGDAYTTFSLTPYMGYFGDDGWEIGFNPFGITTTSYSGHTTTQIMILVAPSYNFKTEGIIYPFIEALFGYTAQSNGSTSSGFSWGGRGGVKLAITDKGLLNLGIQYLQITIDPDQAKNRFGWNQLDISAGFTVWF
jgi:hypothetical protein